MSIILYWILIVVMLVYIVVVGYCAASLRKDRKGVWIWQELFQIFR